MENNISFCSNINFVPCYKFFKNHKNGEFIDYHNDFINVSDEQDFYTTNIADCTAGGVINPHRKSLGFHITGEYLLKEFPIKIIGTPERALLIGSKKSRFSVNSLNNFEAIKNSLQNTVKHLSYFQEHRPYYSSSDIHYSLDDDTWTINTVYGFFREVRDLKSLLKVFKNIKIAKDDRLFIDGKEILPKDCPQIFEV